MNREPAYTIAKYATLLILGFAIGRLIRPFVHAYEYESKPVYCQPIPHKH
jgi:hypothetical protein